MKIRHKVLIFGGILASLFVEGIVSNTYLKDNIFAEENNFKNVAEKKEKILSPYFQWGRDWQELADVNIVTTQKTISSEDDGNGHLNQERSINYDYTVDKGSTVPKLILNAYTFALTGDSSKGIFPRFIDVDLDYQTFTFKNSKYWVGLGDKGDEFKSNFSNWPNVFKWANWPVNTVNTTAYVLYPLGFGNLASYSFKSTYPMSTSTSAKAKVKIDDNSYETAPNYNFRQIWANGWSLEQPQVVKAIFKDIDNPDGTNLVKEEIYGENFELGDSAEVTKKDIHGYFFTSSQIILGSTLNRILEPGHYEKNGTKYAYSNKEVSEAEKTNNYMWKTTLTNQQQGIIFWYKKNTPDIKLTKSVNKSNISLNEKLSYTLEVENKESATDNLNNAKIVDTLPEGMSKLENVRLNGYVLEEGLSSSKSDSYTWDETEKN